MMTLLTVAVWVYAGSTVVGIGVSVAGIVLWHKFVKDNVEKKFGSKDGEA